MLRVQIVRNKEPLRLPYGYGMWHLNCLAIVLDRENVPGSYPDRHTVLSHHEFLDQTDGELLQLQPGDELVFGHVHHDDVDHDPFAGIEVRTLQLHGEPITPGEQIAVDNGSL